MELSDLAVFRAVVEQGGINKASEVLHRVPSNITARVQKLESEVGQPLFFREKNRLKISPAGEHLLTYANQLLALADEALETLHQDQPSGSLKVGCMEAVAATRLSPILCEYHQRYPDVSMTVNTGATGVLIDQVLEGELDLALVADPYLDTRLLVHNVFEERLVLVLDRSKAKTSIEDVFKGEVTVLAFNHRCAYRQKLAKWLQLQNVTPHVFEIASYHALLNCVSAGMGIGIVPKKLLDHYPFVDNLHLYELPDDIAITTTSVVWRKQVRRPSIDAFIELLNDESHY